VFVQGLATDNDQDDERRTHPSWDEDERRAGHSGPVFGHGFHLLSKGTRLGAYAQYKDQAAADVALH